MWTNVEFTIAVVVVVVLASFVARKRWLTVTAAMFLFILLNVVAFLGLDASARHAIDIVSEMSEPTFYDGVQVYKSAIFDESVEISVIGFGLMLLSMVPARKGASSGTGT